VQARLTNFSTEVSMRVQPMLTCLALLLVMAAAGGTRADMAAGVIIGEPTGLSFKAWNGDGPAVDAATGWSFGRGGRFYAHADYLWQRLIEDRKIGGTVPFYFGIGGRLLLRDGRDSRLGVRVPVGLDYFLDDGRLNIFVELAPILDLIPETELDLSGGIGLRFVF
jgi:hypothetical protein